MREKAGSQRWAVVLALIVAGILSLGLIAGCSSNSNQSSQQQQTTSQKVAPPDNTLIVGFDNAYPPYGFVGEDGQNTGIDLDMATEVAKRNGWDIKLEAIDWDAKDVLLGQGTINCIWNGFTIEGREDDYAFSDPYMLNEQVIVVKADSGIDGFADLTDKHVITQIGSAALEVLEGDQKEVANTFAGGAPETIGDYNQAFMQLESGNVDAVACDLSIAMYQMAAKPDVFKQLTETLSSEHYGVGFKLGEDELAKTVTNTLLEMYEDGTIEKLIDKYAEYGVSIENWVLTPENVNGDK